MRLRTGKHISITSQGQLNVFNVLVFFIRDLLIYGLVSIFTAHKHSCRKVMFSVVSVSQSCCLISGGGTHMATIHDAIGQSQDTWTPQPLDPFKFVHLRASHSPFDMWPTPSNPGTTPTCSNLITCGSRQLALNWKTFLFGYESV